MSNSTTSTRPGDHAPGGERGPAAGTGPGQPPMRYTAALAGEIETRWQAWWDRHGTFVEPNPGEPGFDASREKFYCLDMFPYPSGAGLHVGHPEGYTATDIVCRFERMRGKRVLHPMGWDAFGLPAEQYAIQTGIHPAKTTRTAIDTFRGQLKRFGFSYDWSREFATIDPDYYRWTQWVFLKAYGAWFDKRTGGARPIAELVAELERGDMPARVNPDAAEHGGPGGRAAGEDTPRSWSHTPGAERRKIIDSYRLVYLADSMVNWCPKLGTALANEEVIDGKSERGGFPVFRKPLRQWMFRITAYADRLLEGLKGVDWPESTRSMQTEWIGRSEGAEIEFELVGAGLPPLRVFTTRPDTIFGATFMVVAPEHPLVDALLRSPPSGTAPDATAAVREYVERARHRSDVERQENKEKTGVALGIDAINPATGERIPVWTADYVLMGYGHGAIMAVPAHDQRDYDFARVMGLPIRDVVYPRTLAAMAYFAAHATEEERSDGSWREHLADFLGLCTTANAEPAIFEAVLAAVRERRGGNDPDSPENGGTGMPSARGSIRTEWQESIDDLGVSDFGDLERLFATGGVASRVGVALDGAGYAVNSTSPEVSIDGMNTAAAKGALIEWLEASGRGSRRVNYKLRDWLFSRQRYWGEPFPIVFDEEGNHHAVSESVLPVTLPEMEDYQPAESQDPRPLLAKATAWVRTTAGGAGVDPAVLPAGAPVMRETNTMPGWAGSCWYYLRYCDPKNDQRFMSREAERAWMGDNGVDLYIGGAEHAVLHLLYARFWHMILFDLGEVGTPEPFRRLFHQGMITSFAYARRDGTLCAVDKVVGFRPLADGKIQVRDAQGFVLRHASRDSLDPRVVAALPATDSEVEFERANDDPTSELTVGLPLTRTVAKMSKSLKNVINPDEIIAEFGADTFRLYEMYMGPLEASKPWNTRDTVGLFRFLQRAWRLVIDEESGEPILAASASDAIERQLHRTIAKVEQAIPRLSLNTAIAAMIEFVNAATSAGGGAGGSLTRDQAARFALVLAPFAPHMAEEIWHKLGNDSTLAREPWPAYDGAMLIDATIEIPVQVSGKVRARVSVPADADEEAVKAIVMADERIAALVEGKTLRKWVYVPGRLVNLVLG